MERGGGSNCGALQGRGLIPGHRASSIQPPGESGGSQWRPAMQTGGGSKRHRGRGRSAVPTAAWAPAPVRAVAASSAPSKEICCFQQASTIASSCQRRSGWVGEKWGRLAYATESWWADLESRHKLVAQCGAAGANCGSGSPLLQRCPCHSPSISALLGCGPPTAGGPPLPGTACWTCGPASPNSPKPPQLHVPQCLVCSCQSSGQFG